MGVGSRCGVDEARGGMLTGMSGIKWNEGDKSRRGGEFRGRSEGDYKKIPSGSNWQEMEKCTSRQGYHRPQPTADHLVYIYMGMPSVSYGKLPPFGAAAQDEGER